MTDPDAQEESGSALRTKLEAEIAKSTALKNQLAAAVAGGLTFVKPEDLTEFEPDQIATKAQEIESARRTQAEEFARQLLADKLGPDVDLDTLLPKAETKSQPEANAADRLASLGQLGGGPPSIAPETDGTARGDILAGLTD